MTTLLGVWPDEVRSSCSSDASYESLMCACLVLALVSSPLCGVIDGNHPREGCRRIARLKE